MKFVVATSNDEALQNLPINGRTTHAEALADLKAVQYIEQIVPLKPGNPKIYVVVAIPADDWEAAGNIVYFEPDPGTKGAKILRPGHVPNHEGTTSLRCHEAKIM